MWLATGGGGRPSSPRVAHEVRVEVWLADFTSAQLPVHGMTSVQRASSQHVRTAVRRRQVDRPKLVDCSRQKLPACQPQSRKKFLMRFARPVTLVARCCACGSGGREHSGWLVDGHDVWK